MSFLKSKILPGIIKNFMLKNFIKILAKAVLH